MNNEYRMPFGDHKGKPLEEIPVRYLDWLIGVDWMQQPKFDSLRKKITEHLKSRPEWHNLE